MKQVPAVPKYKFSQPWMKRWLRAFAECGSAIEAAIAIRRSRGNVYAWRAKDADFDRAWTEIDEATLDVLEDSFRHRATYGVQVPIVSGGKIIGWKTEYPEGSAQFILSRRRDAYRRQVGESGGAAGTPLDHAAQVREYLNEMLGSVPTPVATAEPARTDVPNVGTTTAPASIWPDDPPSSPPADDARAESSET